MQNSLISCHRSQCLHYHSSCACSYFGSNSSCSRHCIALSMSSWVAEVSDLVDGSGPILTRLTEVLKILDQNLQSTKQKLMPGMVLVHPSNRGSLGLNPYNVHRRCILQVVVSMSIVDVICLIVLSGCVHNLFSCESCSCCMETDSGSTS